MFSNSYTNFVRPSSQETVKIVPSNITGEEARRIYLDEIKEACYIQPEKCNRRFDRIRVKNKANIVENICNKDLFQYVQNDDIEILSRLLDAYPDKLNTCDEFGWSLLMIACQANSINTVKELLKRGVDTSARDKGGNSARSLVIKNRNFILADILLTYSAISETEAISKEIKVKKVRSKVKGTYLCDICNKVFPDKAEHMSSTVHNISASKDKKIPTNYIIPATNKGYQIMLRVGWDKESGLGPEGTGNKYPIRTVPKQDRKGLGLDIKKRKQEEIKETEKNVNKKQLEKRCRHTRNMEINFRREFY